MSSGPRQGKQAEEYVRRKFDLDPPEADWHDGVDQNGIKYEIKSAEKRVSASEDSDETEPGRFRIWEDNHRSMTASEGQLGEAWYIFLGSNKQAVKARATEVTQWVREFNGWDKAGHERRDSRQQKIPWEFVYERVD